MRCREGPNMIALKKFDFKEIKKILFKIPAVAFPLSRLVKNVYGGGISGKNQKSNPIQNFVIHPPTTS